MGPSLGLKLARQYSMIQKILVKLSLTLAKAIAYAITQLIAATTTDTFTNISLEDLNGRCLTIIQKTAAAAGRFIAPTLLDRLTFTPISASDYNTIATGSTDNLSN